MVELDTCGKVGLWGQVCVQTVNHVPCSSCQATFKNICSKDLISQKISFLRHKAIWAFMELEKDIFVLNIATKIHKTLMQIT